MSLEENLYKAIVSLNYADDKAKQCVKICDEFTKSFTEWKDKNYKFFHKHNAYTKRISLSTNAEVFTLTELLEIYKQGL